MATMAIEDARNAALAVHPGWSSGDIENLARGMVAKSELLALQDRLGEEVAAFEASEAERHEAWREANPDGKLLGVVGGIGWGSGNPKDDENMADLFERGQKLAEAEDRVRSRSTFDYERDVVQAWQAKDRALRAGPKADTGPRPATAADARPATIEDAFLALPEEW
jgi:hypothetical protein